jgi:hypothetical protein
METKRRIEIRIDGTPFTVVLNETITARHLFAALPLYGDGRFWGDEIYFDVGKTFSTQDPQEEVEIGDVAYWAPGTALCLFFGRTPASTSDRPRAASSVTVIGKLVGDIGRLKKQSNLRGIEVQRIA